MLRQDSHILSLLKGVLYRVFGTICTILISFIFTGNIVISLSIGVVEVVSKIILYYLYERIWMFAMTKIYKEEQVGG